MNERSKFKIFFSSLKTVVLTVIFFVLITIALIAFSSRFNLPGGFRAYSVLTGSMEPVIQTGSLIITKFPTSTNQINKNDVITFEEPGFENKFITHRVSQVVNSNPGVAYKTKGDANESEDPWIITYGRIKGIYTAHIPYAGSLLEFIKSPVGIIIFIIIPVLLIVTDETKNLISAVADVKIEKERKRKEKEGSVHNHLFVWIMISLPLIGLGIGQTRALFFSNNVFLTNNSIKTALFSPSPSMLPSVNPSATPSSNPSSSPSSTPEPTPSTSPSPSPSSSGLGTNINISGNGSDSNNNVDINNNNNCEIDQESNTDVDFDISSGAISGNNNGNSNIGNSSSSVNVNITGGSDSSNHCP